MQRRKFLKNSAFVVAAGALGVSFLSYDGSCFLFCWEIIQIYFVENALGFRWKTCCLILG